ncbi:MAG: nucleolar RNA-binding Nop10p family protein [Candidatus Aenigmatarchaeota archaeon]
MMILRCPKCGRYTLAEICKCGTTARDAHPMKFSSADRYGKYRRIAKLKSE